MTDQATAAFGAWLQHVHGDDDEGTERCVPCVYAPGPSKGCDEGRRLHGNYRLACIAVAIPVNGS